jgi:RimJ/RimL family protein N-acetyltransferase
METVDNNTIRYNEYNQPIGFVVKDSNKRDRPSVSILKGCYCDLERVNPDRHLDDLYEEVYGPTCNKSNFTYMSIEPFVTKDSLYEYLLQISSSQDPMHYAIIDKESGKALGTMSLMRIDENNGVIEIGNIMYSDKLKHTRIATEAQYLFISYVFDELGYRRYERKCDSLNEPSRKAAL